MMQHQNPTTLVNLTLVAVTAIPCTMAWRANAGQAVTRTRQVVMMNVPGCPDIIGVHRGRAFGVECKAGTGRLNANQIAFRAAWTSAGGLYIVGHAPDQAVADLITGCPP